MSKAEQAVSRFEEGFNCCQAVLAAYGPELGMEEEQALRIAGGFGGGMGRMGEVCGAVTGALMVLGLRYGATDAKDQEAKEHAYSLVNDLAERFKARNGSILCRELLGCDINTPEGRRLARDKGLFSDLCPKLVRDAAEIVEQMLE